MLAEDQLWRIAGCLHAEDVLYGDAHVADDRLAAEHARAHGDPVKHIDVLSHGLWESGVILAIRP